MPQSDEQGAEGNNVAARVCRVPSGRALDQAAGAGQQPETAGGTAASAFVSTKVRQAMQHVTAMGACSA
jgi:hypothetical protein